MYTGKTLFAQIMDFLPWKTFHRLVSRYDGDQGVRTLPSTDHFRVLAFAQLTYRESLRDIEACLSAQSAKLYHMGFRSTVARNTRRMSGRGSLSPRFSNIGSPMHNASAKSLLSESMPPGPWMMTRLPPDTIDAMPFFTP